MNFTEQQLKAISSQSGQTLVSAAAGSGKTRVLTQRIEALVRGADLDSFAEDDGTQVNLEKMEDISRMLVMTFTRAAAAEMRGRIVEALTRAAQAQSDMGNEEAARVLRQQAEAAAGADISTVHSFCSRIIGENYELADVCAGFGILSEEQSTQLMEAAARDVFDERYERDDADIVRLLRKYTVHGRDEQLVATVMRIYRQMMGTDDWEAWLTMPLAPERPGEMQEAWEAIRIRRLEDAIGTLKQAEKLTSQAAEESGDKKIASKAATDRKQLAKLESTLETARAKGADAAAVELGSIRHASTKDMPGILKTAQAMREETKTATKQFRTNEYGDAEADRALSTAHEDLQVLIEIVQEFAARYSERKRALNKVDYADLEHKALHVLRTLRAEGRGYDKYYRHVFVDEYQDTNQVQESILRELTGDNQVFMVGDLKQSIYGFRFADPRIFRSKDVEFAQADARDQIRVHMNHNFRSSPAVIDSVNAVMGCLMRESLGGVDYGDEERLLLGRTDGSQGHAQILIADADAGALTETGNARDEMEAEMIASRIAELAAQGQEYGDIAILLRSRSERVGALETALESRGIPYSAELDASRTFTELDVFLNLLELVVNERRDVPLLSVMRSYMFGFDEADFARIVNWNDLHPVQEADATGEETAKRRDPQAFFTRLTRFREAAKAGTLDDEQDVELARRVEAFFAELGSLRVMGTDMALVRFAEEVGERYDFPAYLLTRPAGASRKKAYDALLGAIADQQEIYGNSLFRVLQAVRGIRKTGKLEAQAAASQANAVRIMTIHASKGLEFPVVFLAATDRQFNPKAAQGDCLLTDRYGIALKSVSEESGVKRDTVETAVVQQYIRETQKSEELRMLYVAMTRARDQLYLCGASGDEEQAVVRWAALAGRYETAKSMLDWIMGAYYELEAQDAALKPMYSGSFWRHGQAVGADVQAEIPKPSTEELVAFVDAARAEGRSDFYGLEPRARVAAVQGVSKRIASERRGADGDEMSPRPPYASSPLRPVSLDGEPLTGAERGTLLHRALQYAVRTRTMPEAAIDQMLRRRLVTQVEADELRVNLPSLQAFFDSSLYARAAAADKVLTEQPFELLISPPETGDYSRGRMRLRGMIDLAFLEDGEWVLVDYKSDRGVNGAELAERYAPQIGYYRDALERISGRKVRESYLFSLERKEAVPV